MKKEEIEKVLREHKKWLDSHGEEGCQADLRWADLQEADLRRADLQRADLREAYLQGADLQRAYLQRADLREAYLQGADLRRADLQRADLQRADLREAYLQEADLQRAYLQRADLREAYLQEADLRWADLRRADLRWADLRRADLQGAYISDTVLTLQCPEEGGFVGFKKCIEGDIVKLFIPSDAKRSSATTRKCRASKAKVLEIVDYYGNAIKKTVSRHDSDFVYRTGETVEVPDFDEDRWNECSQGIHFFLTRREAEEF